MGPNPRSRGGHGEERTSSQGMAELEKTELENQLLGDRNNGGHNNSVRLPVGADENVIQGREPRKATGLEEQEILLPLGSLRLRFL